MNKIHKTHRAGRRAAALAVALAAAFAFAACSPASGNSAQQNEPSDPNTPSEPSEPSAPTASHSDLLYGILANSYYRKIVSDLRESAGAADHSQLYDPIPYGFLEDRGHDISGIKNDTLQADSVAYTKEGEPNHLYIATRAETAAEFPYYTCYTLRYTLSDLEMSDFKLVHDGNENSMHIEAPLFIQELSYQKTPTVLSEASIVVTTYENILKSLLGFDNVSSDLFGTKNLTIDFASFSTINNTIVCYVRNDHFNDLISTATIRTANMVPGNEGVDITTLSSNAKVYSGPNLITFENTQAMQNYMNNVTTVTYFYGQFYLSCACCCTINFRSGSVCGILKALCPSYS